MLAAAPEAWGLTDERLPGSEVGREEGLEVFMVVISGTVVGFCFSALYISEQKVIFSKWASISSKSRGRKPERAECFSKV